MHLEGIFLISAYVGQ